MRGSSRLRAVSKKRRKRNEEVAPLRKALLKKHRQCMICGRNPRRPWRNMPREMSVLGVHEIASGPLRDTALDKPHSLLVVCWYCNSLRLTDRRAWPEARQLAVLLVRSPTDYDLAAHNTLVRPGAPNRITQMEVNEHVDELRVGL